MKSFSAMARCLTIAGAFCLTASVVFADPVYTDPDGSNPDITFLNPSGAAGEFVDLVPDAFSVGEVKLGFWVFTLTDEPGYFYAYELVNISAGSVNQGPGTASLKYYELSNVASHTVLGLGGGKHGGASYQPWTYLGDLLTTCTWAGTTATSIDPGETSPTPADTAYMFELHSWAGPGDGPLYVATTSGGGYTGQSISVWVPVPEPNSIAMVLTGGLALLGLRLRRK
jgi:hypothetical protein